MNSGATIEQRNEEKEMDISGKQIQVSWNFQNLKNKCIKNLFAHL